MWFYSKLCVLCAFKRRFISQLRSKSSIHQENNIDKYGSASNCSDCAELSASNVSLFLGYSIIFVGSVFSTTMSLPNGTLRKTNSAYRRYGTRSLNIRKIGKGEIFLPIFSPSKMTSKVALVTGGSHDIGLLCVRELLGCGVKAIMIADIDEKQGEEVICELSREFGENRAAFIKTDMADIKLLRNAFNWTKKHFEHIDIVINIAKHEQADSWQDQIEKNVKGIVRGTLLGFEYMGIHNGGKGGAVLNMISSPTLDDATENPVFIGARHYIIGFGRAMSNQFNKNTDVKVVSLCTVEEKVVSQDDAENEPEGVDLASLALLAKTGSVWTNL